MKRYASHHTIRTSSAGVDRYHVIVWTLANDRERTETFESSMVAKDRARELHRETGLLVTVHDSRNNLAQIARYYTTK